MTLKSFSTTHMSNGQNKTPNIEYGLDGNEVGVDLDMDDRSTESD